MYVGPPQLKFPKWQTLSDRTLCITNSYLLTLKIKWRRLSRQGSDGHINNKYLILMGSVFYGMIFNLVVYKRGNETLINTTNRQKTLLENLYQCLSKPTRGYLCITHWLPLEIIRPNRIEISVAKTTGSNCNPLLALVRVFSISRGYWGG